MEQLVPICPGREGYPALDPDPDPYSDPDPDLNPELDHIGIILVSWLVYLGSGTYPETYPQGGRPRMCLGREEFRTYLGTYDCVSFVWYTKAC